MSDRIASLLSRASIRLLLAIVLVATTATAGVFASDFVSGEQPAAAESPSASPTAAAAASAATASASDADFKVNGAGGRNVVNVKNTTDNRLVVRGKVQLNIIPSDRVAPVNIAVGLSTCVSCQTYAVAMQLNLYQRGASVVAPQNAAAAVNAGCSGCVTVARAIQYTIPVDDIHAVPNDVRRLAKELDKALKEVEGVYDTSELNVFQANSRIEAVIADFRALGDQLRDDYKVETKADTPSPAPDATPLPTEDVSPSAAPSDAGPTCAPDAVSPDPSAPADATPVTTSCPTSGDASTGSSDAPADPAPSPSS